MVQLLLSRLCREFQQANPHWTSHARQRAEAHFNVLIALVGDRDITALTKQDFGTLRNQLPRVSANAVKRRLTSDRVLHDRQSLEAQAFSLISCQ
jgi:hypothetical protein